MLFAGLGAMPLAATNRAINELAIISIASAGSPAQLSALTPTVINPFRWSPLTLSIMLANAAQFNPLQALFPLSWNVLAGATALASPVI